MIKFLYGQYGSGKTTSILESIKKDTENKIHTFLIVPDQEAVQSEKNTLLLLPDDAQLELEVLSFSRLYNRVCRQYGGLAYRYVTKPIRRLLMWQNMRELSPILEEYNSVSDKDNSVCDLMLSAISECKASAISPNDLEATARKLPQNSPLAKRLRDLALIYSSFDRLVSESYSDSSDDISRLYDKLKEHNFFEGANVYIDSFTSFTGAEHRVIERIFATAKNVTVSVPIPSPDSNEISHMSIKSSEKRLIESAARHGGHSTLILNENKRTNSKTLSFLASNLWNQNISDDEKPLNDGSFIAEICDTHYAEAEAVSNTILELLRSGERCRDMLVLMRDPERYKGIIEPAFEKNDIPYYFSDKTDLNSLPPVKLLFSALRIKQYNWQRNDVITHIKTGMYDIDVRSSDLFEEYVNTWNIKGKRFCEDEDWTMNPDGFAEVISPRGKNILSAANSVRRILQRNLEAFFILLDAAEYVPDMCRAVYKYFTDIELEKHLDDLAAAEANRGNIKGAKELSSIYGIMLETLADIASALPDTSVSTDEFALILKTVFNETEIGTIPTSVDEVMIGSAATLRAANPKYTFVMGLCEGIFPAIVNDKGVFSSLDRATLNNLGLELSSDLDTRSSDELMFATRAFASPSHKLHIYTAASELNGKSLDPSLPFNRAISLIKNYTPHRYSANDLEYLVGSAKTAASHMRVLRDSAEGNALKIALYDFMPDVKRRSELPVSQGELVLSESTVDRSLGKNVTTFSSSRFESYVNCPMSYYCNYVLRLREKVNSDFLSSDMGTFVHAILEKLIYFATTPNEQGELPTDSEITQMTENEVLLYIERICPRELKQSKKLSHVYRRLKNLALLMVRNIAKEFSQSDFVPRFFELSIDGKSNNPPPLDFVHDDGYKFSFVGKIDRVDVYKDPDDGKTYVRVIDYKTGTKNFSLDDVEHGINTQMLLYLFMLCNASDSCFCNELGLNEGELPIPAGVMYLSANVPTLQQLYKKDEEDIRSEAEGELKRSGLLLSDEKILTAMNHELSKRFLAGIYQKKDGELTGDALTSAEEFKDLYSQISETIMKITTELRHGFAGATPLRYGDHDPCEYCKMKPICRKEND